MSQGNAGALPAFWGMLWVCPVELDSGFPATNGPVRHNPLPRHGRYGPG